MQLSLQEQLIIQSLWLDRFKGSTSEEIIKRLEKASKKINAVINSTTNLTDKQRFNAINQVIYEQMSIVYGDLDELLFSDMQDMAETSYNATATLFNSFVTTYGVGTLTPKFKDLKQSAVNRILDKNRPILGNTLKDMKANVIFSANKRLRETIANGLNQDLTLPQIQRNALAIESSQNLFGKLMRNEINTITNTALKSALEESRAEVYNQNKDIAIGWRSSAILDNRTSFLCKSLDNVFYSIEKYPTIDKVPYKPPRHPNCRTILLLETEFDREIQRDRTLTFASGKTVNHRDGNKSTKFTTEYVKTFDSKKSFNDIFKYAGKDFQLSYLGKARYDLYKKHGDKVLRELYDLTKMRKLTLDELKAKLN